MNIDAAISTLRDLVDLGGWVVVLLLVLSVVAGAVVIYKFWQHGVARIGRHGDLDAALAQWSGGNHRAGLAGMARGSGYIAPLLRRAMITADALDAPGEALGGLEAEAELELSKLESGFRLLDSIAQISPLLGLFGTVLGMIDAFRALQDAGQSVDPSILAGGIWVALLTTAVGLAVAMPTSLLLTWFESRIARERVFIDRALQIITGPAARFDAAAEPALSHAQSVHVA
jgi:biopolymer transport protein ExbB